MRLSFLIAAFLMMGIMFPKSASPAGVPNLINYQGRLTDNVGNPLSGTYSIVFTIYNDSVLSQSTNIEWQETHTSVTALDGLFDVVLGAGTPPVPLTEAIFASDIRYLGIKVEDDAEISPRTRLVTVGYSFEASNADMLDGHHWSEIPTGQAPSGTFNCHASSSGTVNVLCNENVGRDREITSIIATGGCANSFVLLRTNGSDAIFFKFSDAGTCIWNRNDGAGIIVPAGQELTMVVSGGCESHITIVGYLY